MYQIRDYNECEIKNKKSRLKIQTAQKKYGEN